MSATLLGPEMKVYGPIKLTRTYYRLLSPLSLECASNDHRSSVRDTSDYHFPPSDSSCRGTTWWLPGVGTLFSLFLSDKVDPNIILPPETERGPSGIFVPTFGMTPGSLRANLAHLNFATISQSTKT